MKNKIILTTVAAGLLAVSFTACSKSETPAKDAADATKSMADKVADSAKGVAAKASDTAKDVAGKTVAAVTNAVSEATGPFSEGVASAKKFIADKNYQGALDELKKLSSLKLTDEQTKIVDNLKAEVQALIAKGTGSATDAVKGLLGK